MSWFNVSKQRRGGYYPHQKDQHRFLGRTKGLLLAAIFLIAQIASPLFSLFLLNHADTADAAIVCSNDSQGANDQPGQKDLSRMCFDGEGAPTSVYAEWNWDDVSWPGGNTGDACALFDSDGDGNVNYAVCVTVGGNPASQQPNSPRLYSCNDSKTDRCPSDSLVAGPYLTSCAVSQQTTDPFSGPSNPLKGEAYPNDTRAACTVFLSEVGGINTSIVDVCSYPSQQPNSDPSDCVVIAPSKGKLEVQKVLDPANDPGLFNLKINGTTYAANVGNGGTTGEIVVGATSNNNSNNASETAGTNTVLTNYATFFECRDLNGTGSVIASGERDGATSWQITVPIADAADVVCVITNTRIAATLTLVKSVINNNGGSALADAWTLSANGPTPISGSSGSVSVTNNAIVANGTYTLSESSGPAGYVPGTYSCVINNGSPAVSNSITLASGDNATCTITNDDDAPSLTLVKEVTNDNGGSADKSEWTLSAEGLTPISGAGGAVSDATFKAGTYTLSETGGPNGYTAGDWDCEGGEQDDNSVTIGLGEDVICTIINDDDAPSLTLNKVLIKDNGGVATEADWTLTATGTGQSPTNLSGPGAASDADVVSDDTFKADMYTLGENGGPSGYSATNWTCTNEVVVTNGQITLGNGQSTVCTITNDDIQPKLTVIKQFGNQYGDDAQISDFPLFVDATGVTSGATNSFDAGTYAVSETNQTGYQNPEFSGDCDSSGEVTLNVGDEDKTCNITNNAQQPKLIVIKHVINDNQGPNDANDFTMTVNGTNVSDDSFPGNEQGTEVTLDEGNYTVDEIEVAGYTKSLSEDCTGTIAVGETKTCTITNDDQTGQVKVTKFYDSNENGFMDGNEASLEGWEIVLGDTTQMTGQDGTTTFENVNAGSHQLSENLQEDWKQSGLYCDYGEAAQVDDNLVYVKNGETLNCFIGNYRDPVLAINKTNSSPNAAVGNTITYTVVITVPEESGRVYGQPGEVYVPATLTDLPPDNFTYVLGSWTANSNIRGDLKAAGVTTEPTYASPGVWNLTSNGSNFLTPGEVITLTYQAVIGDAVTPGTYPDIAYVRGFDNGGGEVLGVAGVAGGVAASQCDDADAFASSCVAIVPPSQVLGASFTAGQVLGLANTGGAISKLQIIVPTLLISLTIIMVFATRRDVAKRGGAK